MLITRRAAVRSRPSLPLNKIHARAVSRAARIRFLPDRPDRFASFRRKDKLAVIQMKEWKVLSVLLTVATEEHIKRKYIAEWSSLVARRAHNPKVPGAKPGSATIVLLVESRYNTVGFDSPTDAD